MTPRAVVRALPGTLMGMARDALSAWLDALFPPRCAGCNRSGAHFCGRCISQLRPVRRPWCVSCGRTVVVAGLCADCRLDPLPLAGVRSAAVFDGPLRRAIHRLKYRGRQAAGRALGDLLVAPVETLSFGPAVRARLVVIPVPLHPARERERGYNQAALIARPLAEALCVPYAPGSLWRVKATASQVGLSRRQRRANVAGAFAASPDLAGRFVLLVDDVATTGSTLAAAADACLAAGAAGVYAVTLAREG